MSAKRRLTELAERKRLLVLQADLHRALLQAEALSLRVRLNPVRAGVRVASPWLLGAGAVAGLLAARRWRRVLRWVPARPAAWRWLRRLTKG